MPRYESPGSTDDIYLRSSLPGAQSIRLTDFGRETGNPDWAPDSRRLIFDSQDQRGSQGIPTAWIIEIDPITGQPLSIEKLDAPDGPPGPRTFSWSPRANEIAVTYPVSGKRYALAVISLDGNQVEKLVEFEAGTLGGLDWTSDGLRIIYSALHNGRMQLYAVAREGGDPIILTKDSANLILPQTSPDGRLIAATRIQRFKELRRLRLQ